MAARPMSVPFLVTMQETVLTLKTIPDGRIQIFEVVSPKVHLGQIQPYLEMTLLIRCMASLI